MNKRYYILGLVLCIISCKSELKKDEAQAKKTYKRLHKNKHWGFVNQKGDTIIPFGKYRFLNPIDDEGMILAMGRGRSGYINIQGDTIIPFVYEDLSVFSHGLAPAKKMVNTVLLIERELLSFHSNMKMKVIFTNVN